MRGHPKLENQLAKKQSLAGPTHPANLYQLQVDHPNKTQPSTFINLSIVEKLEQNLKFKAESNAQQLRNKPNTTNQIKIDLDQSKEDEQVDELISRLKKQRESLSQNQKQNIAHLKSLQYASEILPSNKKKLMLNDEDSQGAIHLTENFEMKNDSEFKIEEIARESRKLNHQKDIHFEDEQYIQKSLMFGLRGGENHQVSGTSCQGQNNIEQVYNQPVLINSVKHRLESYFEEFKLKSQVQEKQQELLIGKLSSKLAFYNVDLKIAANQHKIQLNGLQINFPFQPYEVQKSYMTKILECLDTKSNAVIESPTGTGKTLCLLSSVLSWCDHHYHQTNQQIKVIFMSRTHSQLKQAQKELEKTCYRPTMAVIGSRQQLCIKQSIGMLKGREKVEACAKARKAKRKIERQDRSRTFLRETAEGKQLLELSCQYYRDKESSVRFAKKNMLNRLINMETIKKIAIEEEFCPYYYPFNIEEVSSLYFMPYNYIVDQNLVGQYSTLINKNIIIFDQAHNVADAACEGRSFEVFQSNFENAIKELRRVKTMGEKSEYSISEDLQMIWDENEKGIKQALKHLEDMLESIQHYFKKRFGEEQDEKMKWNNGNEFDRFEKEEKLVSKQNTLLAFYELLYQELSEEDRLAYHNNQQEFLHQTFSKGFLTHLKEFETLTSILVEKLTEARDGAFHNIQKISIFCSRIITLVTEVIQSRSQIENQINHFRIFLRRNKESQQFEIACQCLVSWFTFSQIMKYKPRSLILTSGTLAPLDSWERELRIPFQIKHQNAHVINPEQVILRVIKESQKGTSFTMTYDHIKKNQHIYEECLDTIISLSQKIPNGVLIILPSFKFLTEFQKLLNFKAEKEKYFKSKKFVIFEQRKREDSTALFKEKATTIKGAVLFCVCRGKVAEGIDFPDELCRGVIIVGVPFANSLNPQLAEKKKHYDFLSKKSNCISGEQWYTLDTMRTVNQALGRVIRHSKDYGALFLLDTRYSMTSTLKNYLPKWTKQSQETIISCDTKFLASLEVFFKHMQQTFYAEQKERKSRSNSHDSEEPDNPRNKKRQNSQHQANTKKDAFQFIMGKEKQRKSKPKLKFSMNNDFI